MVTACDRFGIKANTDIFGEELGHLLSNQVWIISRNNRLLETLRWDYAWAKEVQWQFICSFIWNV